MQFDLSQHFKEIQIMNEKMIQIQSIIIDYIDNNEPIENLFNILNQYNIINDKSLFHDFLFMLNSISISRLPTIKKDKINGIIINYKEQILQFFTKNEISSFFKCNPPVLLCLLENEIITYDQISNLNFFMPGNFFLLEKIHQEGIMVPNSFFFNEMEIYYQNHINDFFILRKEYHSESNIARFIRNDDIESFIDLISHSDLTLNSNIPYSIFESDINLAYNMKSMIEYAAAFGALNIFKFLYCQLQTFPDSLLNAAIIGGNSEIIHLLEEKGYQPSKGTIYESIVNHRNDIFEYFVLNYGFEIDFNLFLDSIKSFNYEIMNKILILHPEFLINSNFINILFSNVCDIDFRALFNILFTMPTIDINYKIDAKYMDYVLITIFFFL